ncbi:hypothetical protein QPM17_19090 [Marinobacter sp. TBZ242]|uniref:Pyruvate carboxyltransferase domain-containing protein n=1 Tax=Marinobacter azerbaijanicus TaxID=3050455 RepID=A0ABT7IGG2_9GAMM|nr:hypothetical protein [Marinobacter sp. TBZ242]MDL0433250.1 hypothetical protein [Marinobacter sp. TBZ242]
MKDIRFIDTTLRDGQLSLWAFNMRTGMMLPALKDMDEARFEAIEFFVPAIHLKKMTRDLGEDPWQWLKLGTKIARKTPLRLHGGYKSGLTKVPESISKLLIKKVVDHGITTTRMSNSWNDFDALGEEVVGLRKMGMETVVNIIYSVSPRHTDEYYVARAKAAAALSPYRICFKDVAGLLTPERLRELLPQIQAAVGKITLEFHCHCNNGLGPLNILEAVKLGIGHVHTAIPPLANASSNPSIINVEKNLRALGYSCDVDIARLKSVEEHFENIAKIEGFPVGVPLEYDQMQYQHQVPGGMISNLRYQLRQVGLEDRLDETLEEAGRVRADFGYPIMVTPLAQFVGSQAAINVITGERYRQVTDEVIQYAWGFWGREAIEVMDPDVRDKILNRARAKQLEKWSPSSLSVGEVRKKYGEHLSDEELILRAYVDDEAVRVARNAPVPQPYITSRQPLIKLIEQLTKSKANTYISLQRKGMSVLLK